MGKRKFTADQAREALLATGEEMLQSVGPAGVATVSLAEAINRSGVPRPSAYRVFGGGDLDPQGSFQEQLVLRVIAAEPGVDIAQIREAVAAIVARSESTEGADNDDQLTALLFDLLRTAAEAIVTRLMTDPSYGVYLSASALVRTGEGAQRVAEAIAEHRVQRSTAWQAFYRDLMSTFGLRLRNDWSTCDLHAVLEDTTIGAVLRVKGTTADQSQERSISWLAASYAAMITMATEPDPRRVVAAQPVDLLSTALNP